LIKSFHISLFLLLTVGLFAQKGGGTCSINSVTFHYVSDCDSINNSFYIPVTVDYFTSVSTVIGEPPAVDSIQLRTDSSKYNFHQTFLTQSHVTSNPINTFNFLIYGDSHGGADTLDVTVDLMGDCATYTNTYQYIYTSPTACNIVTPICPENLFLTGLETDSIIYHATTTISSTQIIDTTANITYKAGQSITLGVGFHAKAGSETLLKIEECTE